MLLKRTSSITKWIVGTDDPTEPLHFRIPSCLFESQVAGLKRTSENWVFSDVRGPVQVSATDANPIPPNIR